MNSQVIKATISVSNLTSPGFDSFIRSVCSIEADAEYDVALPTMSETIPVEVTIRREV